MKRKQQEKQKDKTNLGNKGYVQRKKDELMQQHSRMMQEIQSTVSSLNRVTLTKYLFHTIHVNYFCIRGSEVCSPCEIALAEFNFSEGVRRTYHTLINPGSIPLGYKFEAEKLSAETHQIPVPPEEFGGETDYYKVFTNVQHFVMDMKGKYLYPYYTHPDSIDTVKNVLAKLQEDVTEEMEFRIYPLTRLFSELYNVCVKISGGQRFPAFSLAEREFDRDVFNFTKGISCDFHEETEAIPHCSLSCVKRWCFLIMHHCCPDLDIELIPDQHCPRQVDTSNQKIVSRPVSVTGNTSTPKPSSSLQSASKPGTAWKIINPRAISDQHCPRQADISRQMVSRSVSFAGNTSTPKSNSPLQSASKPGTAWKIASPGVATARKQNEPLAPLRLPKTQPEALTNNEENKTSGALHLLKTQPEALKEEENKTGTLIHLSKTQPEAPKVEEYKTSGALSRLPKTQSEALINMGFCGKFSKGDLSAVVTSKHGPLEIEPISVTDRMRMMASKLTSPITLGQDRSLVSFLKEDDLKKLNIE